MSKETPRQFMGTPRFHMSSGVSKSATMSASPTIVRAAPPVFARGKGARGLGQGGKVLKRHQKILRDSIRGVSNNDIRRLARRGGIKRISGTIYNDIRGALRDRLTLILKDIIAVVEYSGRKTVAVQDVIFTLNRHGSMIYGWDQHFNNRVR